MRSKIMRFSSFSQAITSSATCYRPDYEKQIPPLLKNLQNANLPFLARGNGLSYGDCCLNSDGIIIDTRRLNHLLSFDEASGIVIAEPGVTFADLFLVHPNFIPPVIPGTLHATLAGGIANDIHGKNNTHAGTLGQHIQWFHLQGQHHSHHCSPNENSELFQATIGGLGLTGVITRVALKLRKATRFVRVETEKHTQWQSLLQRMRHLASRQDYQVAWLDFLTPARSILSYANHCDEHVASHQRHFNMPPLPIRVISKWGMKVFNHYYFQQNPPSIQLLSRFNNPLDAIKNWNRMYGKKGLLQCQSVFNEDIAPAILNELNRIIQSTHAIPTLSVLKYFSQSGSGLLSFAEPGFTIAIDFINNESAKNAIKQMNELITHAGGKIYLAKDSLLTREQFLVQYQHHQQFSDILKRLSPTTSSDLTHRLGLAL